MTTWPIGVLPRIVGAGRYRLDDRGYPIAYRHPTIAIHQHGYHARVRFDGLAREVHPGDITVSPPGGETRYDLAQPGPCWCVHFSPPAAAAGGEGMLRLPQLVRPGGEARFFGDRFSRIVGWAAGSRAAAGEAARAALYELVAALAAHVDQAAGPTASALEQAVERATVALDRRYRAEVDIAALCRELRVRQDRLSAAFRRRHGCAMIAYVSRRRVDHAHLLLQTTDLPVAAVAAMAGFADRRYFTRVFRGITGIGPQAVRAARGRKGR